MIKLCTIDLDGTLLDDEKNISTANRQALIKAQENGCKIVIATGRPAKGIISILKHLDLLKSDDYVICYNGAKVFNTKTKEVVYTSTISGKTVKELYLESKRLGLNFHAFKEDEQLVTDIENPYTDVEIKINKISCQIVDFLKINDDEKFLKCMMVSSKENITKGMNDLNPKYYNEYCVMRSSAIFLEFLNKKTNKGTALEALAKHLSIPIAETMAIGDAGNDLEMIKKAGVGVAMENSFDEIKKAAVFVTANNNNGGVALAIDKFINAKNESY